MDNLLEVRGLRLRYGAFEAVHGVDFTLAAGEILGIVGESGSGKSTLAKALTGLIRPAAGTIAWRTPAVQMIFQDATGSLNPRLTIRSTLEEVVRLHRSRRSAEELVELVGLAPTVLGQYPRELSGGQCQRISIARALAASPRVLVADESVSALDVSVQARVLNLLRELRDSLGLAIVFIAHDLAVVRNLCDRIAVMERGNFVEMGDPEIVLTAPRSDYVRRLLAAVPRL